MASTDGAAPPGYRLPRTVRPVRYRLELAPDMAAATFSGRVEIDVEVLDQTAEIILHAVDLQLTSATVRTRPEGATFPAAVTIDEPLGQAALTLPSPIRPGQATVAIEFNGLLNDQLRGFYRSRFTAGDGTEHTIATTQFEPTEARRAFPCWDEPELKATFALSLVAPDSLTVLTCSPPISSVTRGDGTKRVSFAETMKMSTYVLAWIVGPFELTDPVEVDGTPLRLATVPGRLHLTGFGADIATHALRWLSSYCDLPYPGEKLDHVAIPDFPYGAMENLGCVTYRDTALLVDPVTASRTELMRVAEVVCHETAHMWFGDLVTMKWWNGGWLKEAFATFMQLKATEAFRPQWEVWTAFAAVKTASLSVDGLQAARPIEPEVGPVGAGSADAKKGASVLRMLEQYLGEDTFQLGIRRYLDEHRYATTEASDVWDALEAVSGEPVRTVMDPWIRQSGHPVVSVEGAPGDRRVTLRPRRFLYTADPGKRGDGGGWVVPVKLKAGVAGQPVHRTALVEGPTEVDFGGPVQWVVVNEGAGGFYRSAYSSPLLAALQDEFARCDPAERVALIDDTWATVLAGATELSAWAGLATRLAEEDDPAVWSAFSPQAELLDMVAEDEDRPLVQAFIRRVAGPALQRLGWDGKDGEPDQAGIARGHLVRLLGTIGADAGVRAEALARFDVTGRDPRAVAPDLLTAVVLAAAASGGESIYTELRRRLRAAETPQQQVRYALGLAGVPETARLLDTLDLAVSEEVRSQDGPHQIASVLANRAGGEAAWSWVEANQERIAARFPPSLQIRIFEGVAGFVDPALIARIREFFSSTDLSLNRSRVAQLQERLDINLAFAARARVALRKGNSL